MKCLHRTIHHTYKLIHYTYYKKTLDGTRQKKVKNKEWNRRKKVNKPNTTYDQWQDHRRDGPIAGPRTNQLNKNRR